MSKYKGLGVAMITPFSENGNVDFAALQRLVEHQIKGGTNFLVVHGTTGESATLTKEEKRATLDFVKEINSGKLPIVLGIGGNNTKEVCETLERTDLKGVDAILSVSPSYNKPTQEGIYQHFKAVSQATGKDIILYNVPGRTGSNMEADTTVRCAEDFKNVIAVKEASGSMDQVMRILRDRPVGFQVLSGDDPLTLPMIACGAEGLISVVGNAFPFEYSSMINDALAGDYEAARINHFRLLELIHWLFVDGNPAGIKEVLKYMNICNNYVRLPLVPVSKNVSNKLYNILAEAELVMA